jgi:Mucin-2 protein WxxW repeating region
MQSEFILIFFKFIKLRNIYKVFINIYIMNVKKSLVVFSLSFILVLSLGFVSAGLFNKKTNYVVDMTGDAVDMTGDAVDTGGIDTFQGAYEKCVGDGGTKWTSSTGAKYCDDAAGFSNRKLAAVDTVELEISVSPFLKSVSCQKYCKAAFGSSCGSRNSHGDGIVEFNCIDGNTAYVYLKGAETTNISASSTTVSVTDWLNRDSPSGSGDYETLKDFIKGGKVICEDDEEVVGVECQTTKGVDYTDTGEKVTCRVDVGAVCRNADQDDEKCEDYQVRFLCGEKESIITLPVEKINYLGKIKDSTSASGISENGVACIAGCSTTKCKSECRYAMALRYYERNPLLPSCYGEENVNCEVKVNSPECSGESGCFWGVIPEDYLESIKEITSSGQECFGTNNFPYCSFGGSTDCLTSENKIKYCNLENDVCVKKDCSEISADGCENAGCSLEVEEAEEVVEQEVIIEVNQTINQTPEVQEQIEQIQKQDNSLCLGSSCKLFKGETINTTYNGKALEFAITYLQHPSVILSINGNNLAGLGLKQTVNTGGMNIEINEIGSEYVIFTLFSGVCTGCSLNNKCYSFGYRTSSRYCDDSKTFLTQKGDGEVCDNSFQCRSQICIGECIDKGQWDKFGDWFKGLFRGGSSSSSSNTESNVASEEGFLDKIRRR